MRIVRKIQRSLRAMIDPIGYLLSKERECTEVEERPKTQSGRSTSDER